jgi:hypothetical protein
MIIRWKVWHSTLTSRQRSPVHNLRMLVKTSTLALQGPSMMHLRTLSCHWYSLPYIMLKILSNRVTGEHLIRYFDWWQFTHAYGPGCCESSCWRVSFSLYLCERLEFTHTLGIALHSMSMPMNPLCLVQHFMEPPCRVNSRQRTFV